MIGFEDVAGALDVFADLALFLPRKIKQRVQVTTNHRGFSRHRRHHLQLLQFGFGFFASFLGEAGGGNACSQLFDVALFVSVTEFLLDRLDLFVQEVFALVLVHLLLDTLLDLFFDLDVIHQLRDTSQNHFSAKLEIGFFKDHLTLISRDVQIGTDRV